MLNSLGIYIKMTEEEKEALHNFILEMNSQETQDDLTVYDTIDKKIAHIRLTLMSGLNLELSDAQIKTILDSQKAEIEQLTQAVLAQHKEKLRPSVFHALQIGLCIAAIYTAPDLLAVHTGKELAKKLLAAKLGEPYGNQVANLIEPMMIGTGYYFNIPQLNSVALLNSHLPDAAKVSVYRHIPAFIIAQKLLMNASAPLQKLATVVTDEQVVETAGDFFDMMYGRADDATIAKYKGSLATKPIDEVAADTFGGIYKGISWLWNQAPNLKGAQKTAVDPSTSTIANKLK